MSKMHGKINFHFKTPSHTEQAVIVPYLFPTLRKEVIVHVSFIKFPALYCKVTLGYLEHFLPLNSVHFLFISINQCRYMQLQIILQHITIYSYLIHDLELILIW